MRSSLFIPGAAPRTPAIYPRGCAPDPCHLSPGLRPGPPPFIPGPAPRTPAIYPRACAPDPRHPLGPATGRPSRLASAAPRDVCGIGLARPPSGYSTRASAAAGRSRAARQPPSIPAIRPPATASATARMMMFAVTGAVRCTVVEGAAVAARIPAPRPGNPPPGNPPPPGNVRAPPGVAEPVVWPTEALSGGATLDSIFDPAKPSPTLTMPPMVLIVIAPPMTG